MKRLIAYHLSMLICAVCMAQTSLDVSDLSVPTKIAPAYFGPNAFPVPDMMSGRTSGVWKLEAYADNFVCTGYRWDEDYTADAFLRLTIPLFSERANLVIWGPLVEYFQTGSDVCKMRRIDSDAPISKVISGDIYVSTDFMLLTQKKHGIDVSMRAALKTASGNDYATARYYDNAGYFFDTAAAHTFTIIPKRSEFILSASGGFLCWQTDNGRQNDAVMYGLRASYRYKGVSFSSEYGGYVGWEKEGDAPMTLKSTLSGKVGNIVLSIGHQIGFRDWPFQQLRIGFAVNL